MADSGAPGPAPRKLSKATLRAVTRAMDDECRARAGHAALSAGFRREPDSELPGQANGRRRPGVREPPPPVQRNTDSPNGRWRLMPATRA